MSEQGENLSVIHCHASPVDGRLVSELFNEAPYFKALIISFLLFERVCDCLKVPGVSVAFLVILKKSLFVSRYVSPL